MFRSLLIAAACLALPAHGGEVHVAVASNFAVPMQTLAAQFEKETGHKARLSFGATGKFYAQIVNGAPFEILLAADQETPARLIREGKADGASRFTYAIGKLVLWSTKPGYVDDAGAALGRADLAHLAIANPDTAPYGKAGIATLRALGLYDRLKARLVVGENISQTYQFAATGNAQAGLVALSQVFEHGALKSGSAWIVPARLYSPLRQDAVLLRQRGQPANAAPAPAMALMAFLKSQQARQTIRQFGYDLQND